MRCMRDTHECHIRGGTYMPFDLVIRSGTVVDGTGAAPRTADIAIDGDRNRRGGHGRFCGRREIEADGAMVALVRRYPHPLRRAGHLGSTPATVVRARGHDGRQRNCGVGFAPVRPRDQTQLVSSWRRGGPARIGPQRRTLVGMESIADYLDALERRTYDVDVAAQVCHAPVRLY